MPKGKPLSPAHRKAISEGLKKFHKGITSEKRRDVREAVNSLRSFRSAVPKSVYTDTLRNRREAMQEARRALKNVRHPNRVIVGERKKKVK